MNDQTKALEIPVRLEVEKLRLGSIVKPEGQLGTIGWYPKAWQAAYVTNKCAIHSFLNSNHNWNTEDINGVKNET